MIDEQYRPQGIEAEVQQIWEERQMFKASEDLSKEKFYCLSMFPYPSGYLHMGHVRNYTIGDVIARYQRMLGKNVLQPIGWDAFGLPAENAALQHGVAPAKWTYENIAHMRAQFKQLGFAYDWSREITTCLPEYYRWEQWLFLRMYEKGLVYKKNAIVNWDPVDQTVLANEQVVNGRGWRSKALIERREIPQWFIKITDYAEELLEELDNLTGWPEQVVTMQRNWIGRSEGAKINFPLADDLKKPLQIFTTRPDTLFGVSYIAIAPEHTIAKKAATENPHVAEFIEQCKHIKVAEADLATMEKRGVATGYFALHPITQEQIPIWVANFVLAEYGSGAVMAVPAHDQRDYEFAQKYQLAIKPVIQPINSELDFSKAAYTQPGILINSGKFSGLTSEEANGAIIHYLSEHKLGSREISYRLRDWGISRQRYWGTPIPMINCEECGTVPVLEEDLPVILPENVNFTESGSLLKSLPEFYETICPKCENPAHRETDTFDTFIESSWYYARFACKQQDKAMLDDRARYWTPVDQYVGGIEHAVMHLLYVRFFHKVLRDEGFLITDEPIVRLLTQGMVLKDGSKMSKSKGNTVDPQQLIDKFGADTVRFFSIFAAPPEQSLEWSDAGVEGCYRFLRRVWAFAKENEQIIKEENIAIKNESVLPVNWQNIAPEQREVRREIYSILKQASFDMERLQLNTVAAACMKLLNVLGKVPGFVEQEVEQYEPSVTVKERLIHEGFAILLRLLNPISPHVTQTLWKNLSYGDHISRASWPKVANSALLADKITIIVQVNGKLRARVEISVDAKREEAEKIILNNSIVQKAIADKPIKKIIYVPEKLMNIVV